MTVKASNHHTVIDWNVSLLWGFIESPIKFYVLLGSCRLRSKELPIVYIGKQSTLTVKQYHSLVKI